MRPVPTILALSVASILASPVSAQPSDVDSSRAAAPSSSAWGTPTLDSAGPDAAREPRRGDRVHDGVFLRAHAGPGYLFARTRSLHGAAGAPGVDRTSTTRFSGAGADLTLLAGGSPRPGLELGGAIAIHDFSDPEVRSESVEGTTEGLSVTQVVIGPFLQFYPDAERGFFLRGLAGFSTLTLELEGGDQVALSRAGGFAVSAAIGYDFWVSRRLSVGPELSLTYGVLQTDAEGREASGLERESTTLTVPMLSVGVTYN